MSFHSVLVLVAMESEWQALSLDSDLSQLLAKTYPVSTLQSGSKQLTLVQTHVGAEHAAIASTLAINRYKPDLVIKFGCVGGASKDIHQGTIIVPLGYFHSGGWISQSQKGKNTRDIVKMMRLYGDKPFQVTTENLRNIGPYIDQEKQLRDKFQNILVKQKINAVPAHVGSGSIWYYGREITEYVTTTCLQSHTSKTWVADMESYPIAVACEVQQIPFISLLATSSSDYYNEAYNPQIISEILHQELAPLLYSFIKEI